jgi:hypothetical protein
MSKTAMTKTVTVLALASMGNARQMVLFQFVECHPRMPIPVMANLQQTSHMYIILNGTEHLKCKQLLKY